jgi:hypothetical protein
MRGCDERLNREMLRIYRGWEARGSHPGWVAVPEGGKQEAVYAPAKAAPEALAEAVDRHIRVAAEQLMFANLATMYLNRYAGKDPRAVIPFPVHVENGGSG